MTIRVKSGGKTMSFRNEDEYRNWMNENGGNVLTAMASGNTGKPARPDFSKPKLTPPATTPSSSSSWGKKPTVAAPVARPAGFIDPKPYMPKGFSKGGLVKKRGWGQARCMKKK